MNIKLIGDDTSEVRIDWVIKQLKYLPKGIKILDAGAGQLDRFTKSYIFHKKNIIHIIIEFFWFGACQERRL
tara:strand:- start:209 stop:424 length:216 start_codon:yes stop_codon:yes gene_type:complete